MVEYRTDRIANAEFFDNYTRNVNATALWQIFDKTDSEALCLFLSNIREGLVLDIGCGDGRNIPLIINHSHQYCVGIDLSITSLQKAKIFTEGMETDFVLCDGINLPFRSQVFVTSVIVDVLHHNMNITPIISEIWRVQKLQSDIFVKDLTYTPFISIGIKVMNFLPKRMHTLFSGFTHNLDQEGREPHRFDFTLNHIISTLQEFGFQVMNINKSSFFVLMIEPILQMGPLSFLTRSKTLAIGIYKLDEWLGRKLLSRFPRIVRISARLVDKHYKPRY